MLFITLLILIVISALLQYDTRLKWRLILHAGMQSTLDRRITGLASLKVGRLFLVSVADDVAFVPNGTVCKM